MVKDKDFQRRVEKRTLRDQERDARVSEATRKAYHPSAIEMAGKYLSIPMPALAIINMLEHTFDMPQETPEQRASRDLGLRVVRAAFIRYARFGIVGDREVENYVGSITNPSSVAGRREENEIEAA